jgi:putative Holliday junction resolvase
LTLFKNPISLLIGFLFNFALVMGRILAIDYGSKKTGLAVTDELQIIANGLATVHSSKLIAYLKEYTSKENVECFVVGEAKNMDNTKSDSARFIEPFVTHLKRKFPNIRVERMDERFTSKIAFQSMIDAGLGKKSRQNKELVDKISATLILQSWMEYSKNKL